MINPTSSPRGDDSDVEDELECELYWDSYDPADNMLDIDDDFGTQSENAFFDPFDRYYDDYAFEFYGYDLAEYEMYSEDEHVRNHERIQQEDDNVQEDEERRIRAEREQQEWPEYMPRQYDESPQAAQRRHIVMTCLRRFLNI